MNGGLSALGEASPVLLRLNLDEHGDRLLADMAPGFELLAAYFESDLDGVDDPYPELLDAIANASASSEDATFSTNGFAMTIGASVATFQLHSRPEQSADTAHDSLRSRSGCLHFVLRRPAPAESARRQPGTVGGVVTEHVVTRLWTSADGWLKADTVPGYELVSQYLRADLTGRRAGVYPVVYHAAALGLKGIASDEVQGNAFAAEVRGLETVIENVYTYEAVSLSTVAFRNALDAYAEWDRIGQWSAPPQGPTGETEAYLYAKAFVLADVSWAVQVMHAAFAVPGHDPLLKVRGAVIDVTRNSDFTVGVHDFLHWPVIMDVEGDGVTNDDFVTVLSDMLRASWAAEIPMVVASPLENLLPWSGGIDRIRPAAP